MPVVDVVLVAGNLGVGKTQLSTAFALDEAKDRGPKHPGRDVYCNYPITPQSPEFDTEEFRKKVLPRLHYIDNVNDFLGKRRAELQQHPLQPKDEGKDLLILDEAWEYAHGRESMSRGNIDFVAYVRLARKLGFELVVTTQLKSQVDKNIRVLSTKNILAERHDYYEKDDEALHSYYEYTVFSADGWATFDIDEEAAKTIHGYYNTMVLQSPGARQAEAMQIAAGTPAPQAQKGRDMIKEVLAGLQALNKRLEGNPFLALNPQKAQRFFRLLDTLDHRAAELNRTPTRRRVSQPSSRTGKSVQSSGRGSRNGARTPRRAQASSSTKHRAPSPGA